MSTPAKLVTLITAGVITALLSLAGGPTHEPSYQDKPLSYWIELFSDTNGPYGRPSETQFTIATNALQHIGTNAIPLLVDWVAYDAEGRRHKHLGVNPESELRAVQAAAALISFGPDASPAFPELGRILTDAYLFGAGTTALAILRRIGEPAVPTLAYAMTNKPSRMRDVIVMNLGHMGPKAHAAVPALNTLLQDSEPGLSNMCVTAIEEITRKRFTNTPAQ